MVTENKMYESKVTDYLYSREAEVSLEMLVVLSAIREMHAADASSRKECPLKIYVELYEKSRVGDKLHVLTLPFSKFSLNSTSGCICDCVD